MEVRYTAGSGHFETRGVMVSLTPANPDNDPRSVTTGCYLRIDGPNGTKEFPFITHEETCALFDTLAYILGL